MQLDLNEQERALLQQLLQQAIGETKAEVRRSETKAFRDQLHEDQNVLVGLLRRLEGGS